MDRMDKGYSCGTKEMLANSKGNVSYERKRMKDVLWGKVSISQKDILILERQQFAL